MDETRELKERYFEKIPTMQPLQKKCRALVWNHGYVEDIFGKRYGLDTNFSYKAINRVVQGGSANVLKTAMVQVMAYLEDNYLANKVRLLLTIHDELNFEIANDLPNVHEVILTIKRLMEEVYPITQHGIITEVDVEYTNTNWADKNDYDLTDDLVAKKVKGLDLSDYKWYTEENTPQVNWFLQAA